MFYKEPTQEQVDKSMAKYLDKYLDVNTIRSYVADVIFNMFEDNRDLLYSYKHGDKADFVYYVKELIEQVTKNVINETTYKTKISQDFIVDVVKKIKDTQLPLDQ